MSNLDNFDKDSISVRLPKPEAEGSQPLLNEDGYAVLNRESLYVLFDHDPDSVRRIAPLLEPEDNDDVE